MAENPHLPTPDERRRGPSRRALVLGGLGVGAVVVAGGAVGAKALIDGFRDLGGGSGNSPSDPNASTSPRPLPQLDGVPAAEPSFGPNGTHWPSGTPWFTGDVDVEVESACSWPAIAAAITDAIATAEPDATVRILVAPGTLPGFGAGSGSPAALQDVGDIERTTRVLVYPRDGYGTVTVTESWRWLRVYGVAFAGIVTTGGFLASGCTGSAFARMRVDTAYNVYGVDGVDSTENVELVEVVVPNSQLRDEDVSSLRTPSAGRGALRYITRVGCYTAPGYKKKGSNAHTDTVQLSGQNDNYYGDFTSIDCIDFASTNTAMQIGSAPNVRYQHCLVVGGEVGKDVYPLPDEAEQDGSHGASNGPGSRFGCTAIDTTFIGSMGAATWGEVENSTVGYASTADDPEQGEWIVDPDILTWRAADIRELSPEPTAEYLARIWAS